MTLVFDWLQRHHPALVGTVLCPEVHHGTDLADGTRTLHELAGAEGIEPPLVGLEATVLPLNDTPVADPTRIELASPARQAGRLTRCV